MEVYETKTESHEDTGKAENLRGHRAYAVAVC